MKVLFNIEYRTVFGETLVMNFYHADRPQEVIRKEMTTVDGCHWKYESTAFTENSVARYYYSVERNGVPYRTEWHVIPHHLQLNGKKLQQYLVYDVWMDIPEDTYLYSTAFTDCLAKHSVAVNTDSIDVPAILVLKVRVPQLADGERLVLSGDDEALGRWDLSQSVTMTEQQSNEWVAVIDVTKLQQPVIAFKFVVLKDGCESVIWETGDNRVMNIPFLQSGDCLVYELSQPIIAHEQERFAGTLVPVFSLRSRTSFGVGQILLLAEPHVYFPEAFGKTHIDLAPRFPHQPRHPAAYVLRRDLHLSADMMAADRFKEIVLCEHQIIEADARTYKHLLDARHRPQFLQQIQIIAVIRDQAAARFRRKTLLPPASAARKLPVAGRPAKIRRGAAHVVNISLESGKFR